MSTSNSSFTKCCFSAPLRYGLLVWAYFKLVTSIIIFVPVFIWSLLLISAALAFGSPMFIIALVIAIPIILLLDIIFNLVLIIGAHKKHTTLLRVYYRYGIARGLVITASALLIIVYKVAPGNNPYEKPKLWPTVIFASAFCVSMILHTYLLILVRSEVLKLKANSQLKFSNHIKDPTCVMQGLDDV